MIRCILLLVCLIGTGLVGYAGLTSTNDLPWGFFGHRRINRLATFTLPEEMVPVFRGSIDYLTEHAVDPDKRRYATEHEAVRHYIDLDHWGVAPYENVSRDYVTALQQHSVLQQIDGLGNTTEWRYDTTIMGRVLLRSAGSTIDIDAKDYRRIWFTTLLPTLYDEDTGSAVDSMHLLGFPPGIDLAVVDTFSGYGILPYHLLSYHRRLTAAFTGEDTERLLQLAAEMGHYVADAHVPLHTTENYNGQLTNQLGIHAFWESRLPELFADEEYDYFVGPAEYIEDPQQYYWDIVLHSNSLVDSVLNTERQLRQRFPPELQRCHDERGGRDISTPCEEFSRAWSEAMNGMVEDQFRASIRSVGSVWYSCWVDAGQPDMSKFLAVSGQGVKTGTEAEAHFRE